MTRRSAGEREALRDAYEARRGLRHEGEMLDWFAELADWERMSASADRMVFWLRAEDAALERAAVSRREAQDRSGRAGHLRRVRGIKNPDRREGRR